MTNPTGKGGFQKGQSGNPKGRPPKDRALTLILEKAGNRTIPTTDGKKRGRKHVLADLLWEAATTGKLTLPPENNDEPPKIFKLDGRDWLGVVQFIYKHIDGPPKSEIDITSDGEPLTPAVEAMKELFQQMGQREKTPPLAPLHSDGENPTP